MRRALLTCILSFNSRKWATETGQGVVAIPEIREVSNAPCDTGSEPSILDQEFGSLVDLTRVPMGWNKTSAPLSLESKLTELETRAREARSVLRELLRDAECDDHVVVVTHGAFLHFLTNDYYNIATARATGWENAEFRSYQFVDLADGDVSLVETQESWRNRRGDTIRPSDKVQAELRRTYYRELETHLMREYEHTW